MTQTVATLLDTRIDLTGAKIVEIYAVDAGTYAVYRSGRTVRVHFSDDPSIARLQRDALASVEALRAQIMALLANWRESRRWMWGDVRQARDDVYLQRQADALVAGLGGFPEISRTILETVRDDLLAEMQSVRRLQYLAMAMASLGSCAFGILMLDLFLTGPVGAFVEAQNTLFAASMGMIGAMFSIGLGLRQKTLQANALLRDNFVEASLRITIGAISAVVLFALIQGKIVSLNIGATDLTIGPELTPIAVIVGVVAGFSERLVGNFLETISLDKRPAGAPPVAAVLAAAEAGRRVRSGQTAAEAEPRAIAVVLREATHDEHVDGCACDLEEDELTEDVELPPARGGVAV